MVGASLLDAELPGDTEDLRILELERPGHEDTVASMLAAGESVDFIVCRDVLCSSPHPMALLSDLWRIAAPAAVLLLDSAVLTESDNSGYARFVPAAGGGWIPGRLALRWMVEASGFDVERWLGEVGDDRNSTVGLRAIRSERKPASSAP